METAENKYITVAYKLYTTEDGKRDLVEETSYPLKIGLSVSSKYIHGPISMVVKISIETQ